MFRGEKEEILDLILEPDRTAEAPSGPTDYERGSRSASASPTTAGRPTAGCSTRCAGPGAPGSWSTSASTCGCGCAQAAEDEAVRVFAPNLRDLLLAAPAGTRPTLGLDPGFRTGVKVAVVDATGKVVATDTIYPHVPRSKWDESLAALARLAQAAQGRADRHRQRHRVAGDRQAGRRADHAAPGAEADQGGGLRGRRLGVLGLRLRLGRNCPSWTCRSAARSRSPAGCRTRWPSW